MFSSFNVVILFLSFIHNSYGRRRVLSSDSIHSDEVLDNEIRENNTLHDLTFSKSTALSNKDSTDTAFDDIYSDPMLSARRRLNNKLLSSTANTPSKTTLNPEDHRVMNLPGLDRASAAAIKQYAGHLPVNKNNEGFLFYWLFEAAHEPENAPLVIWLNGGPGCSSMDGLFLELGPLRLKADNNGHTAVTLNPHSWHQNVNMLFIDQPVGTGLAYTNNKKTGHAHNDEMVADHFYYFLNEFFQLHSKYVYSSSSTSSSTTITGSSNSADNSKHSSEHQRSSQRKTRALYITGESHAGHYIPYISDYILKKNNAILSSSSSSSSSTTTTSTATTAEGVIIIDLQGVALGNPWIDPISQYDVSDYVHGFGIISLEQKYKLMVMNQQCETGLLQGKYRQNVCFNLLDDVIDGSTIGNSQKVLMYDIRQFVSGTKVFPPGHQEVEMYLNRDDVRTAIHSTISTAHHRFQECADPPYNALAHQDGKGVITELENILNQGIRVLVFSGQYDIICNHIGSDKALRRLTKWKDIDDWKKAQRGVYLVNNAVAGYVKECANLATLLVLNSGHMVPLDLPHIALDFFNKFISSSDNSDSNSGSNNKSLSQSQQQSSQLHSWSAGYSKLSGTAELPITLQCIKPDDLLKSSSSKLQQQSQHQLNRHRHKRNMSTGFMNNSLSTAASGNNNSTSATMKINDFEKKNLRVQVNVTAYS